jgi:hypothetical protein
MLRRLMIAVVMASAAACSPAPATTRFLSDPTDKPASAIPTSSAASSLDDDPAQLALSGLDAATAAPYVSAASADPWVLQTVAGHRAEPVEVVDPGDGKSGIWVSIYDYTASHVLKVGFGADRTIVDRVVGSGQPGFSPREITRAVAMVTSSVELAAAADGVAYEVQSTAGAFPKAFQGHRVIAVILSPVDATRVGQLIAYADLSADAVVSVDPVARD